MRTIFTPIALSGILALGLAGCTINIGETSGSQHGMMDGDNDSESSQYSMNDIMFAQMMIPHHEQAVELAMLAESHTTTLAILDLASRIKNAQSPEIEQMQSWLDVDGTGMDMSHDMNMPGIVSDADMASIRAAQGEEFDILFLTHMVEHHKGAIEMVNDLIADSANSEVKALGQAIVKAQTTEIAEMEAMLYG